MSETSENWLGLVNSFINDAHQTREIYQVLPYSVDFKTLQEFEIHWVRQYLVNLVLLRIKNLQISEITVKLKSNLYVGPVNIFPNFLHCLLCRTHLWPNIVFQYCTNIYLGTLSKQKNNMPP